MVDIVGGSRLRLCGLPLGVVNAAKPRLCAVQCSTSPSRWLAFLCCFPRVLLFGSPVCRAEVGAVPFDLSVASTVERKFQGVAGTRCPDWSHLCSLLSWLACTTTTTTSTTTTTTSTTPPHCSSFVVVALAFVSFPCCSLCLPDAPHAFSVFTLSL